MNLKTRQLEEELIAVLNGSDLPMEVKRFVVKSVYHLVEKEADKAILDELKPITEYGENYNAESV